MMRPQQSVAARLAELDAERAKLLEQEQAIALDERRKLPIALHKLAEEMGVKERPLIDAAKAGRLKAWRLGGKKRGEFVTTIAHLEAYLETQPASTRTSSRSVKACAATVYELAIEAARRGK